MTQKGVTLVELMIVILIIGIIAAAASPFTSAWVKDARTTEGAAAMEEAIGKAKSAAMRNTARVIGAEPASMICLDSSNTKISLLVPTDPDDEMKCDSTPVWTVTLSDIVSIKAMNLKSSTESDWSCTCFTNKGLPTKEGVVCGACSDSLNFKFTHDGNSGAEGDERNFY